MRFVKQKRASSDRGIRGFSIAKNFLNSFLRFLVRNPEFDEGGSSQK
jgi:hypothetical protein